MEIDFQEYQAISKKVNEGQIEIDLLSKELESVKDRIGKIERRISAVAKARALIQETARDVQKNLEAYTSSIVSLALSAVFPRPPEFVVRMVTRRNQTECDLFFQSKGNLCDPVDGDGGGALDVASFALRVCLWSMKRTRPTLLLDEPFKFVSPDYQGKVSEMVKMLSEKLGLQIIMVSHAEDINYAADRYFWCEMKGEISRVEVRE
jgi:hypothetical protein